MPKESPRAWTINEDGSAELMARVRGNDAAYITQASIASIAYKAWNKTTGDQINPSEPSSDSITVNSAVFDTLQTDSFWTDADGVDLDSTGYNFRFTLPASVTGTPNPIAVEVRMTDDNGDLIILDDWTTINIDPSRWD